MLEHAFTPARIQPLLMHQRKSRSAGARVGTGLSPYVGDGEPAGREINHDEDAAVSSIVAAFSRSVEFWITIS
jgi:hypothetical protein